MGVFEGNVTTPRGSLDSRVGEELLELLHLEAYRIWFLSVASLVGERVGSLTE